MVRVPGAGVSDDSVAVMVVLNRPRTPACTVLELVTAPVPSVYVTVTIENGAQSRPVTRIVLPGVPEVGLMTMLAAIGIGDGVGDGGGERVGDGVGEGVG